MKERKWQVWLPLLVSVATVVGMFFGYKLHQKSADAGSFFSYKRPGALEQAFELVSTRYVDSLGIDTLRADAIEELLEKLDPHSVYLDPEALQRANEEMSGRFTGLGIELNLLEDTVHVLHVLAGSPAQKAGLLLGDRILRIGNKAVAGPGTNIDSVRSLLRGKAGTNAELTVLRNRKGLSITAVRATIPLPSVEAAYLLQPGIGYIRLARFSEGTYRECMDAMLRLQKEGMKSLVFDLRSNPGGIVTEAVHIADEFLDGDKLITYTEGAHSKREEYRAKKDGIFETGKLVVLQDELSASAAELLAGALQDWDRATVIGRRSFGKGLVQEQLPLRDGAALRLTVARYYTPLGRSIQRPYAGGKKIYMEELLQRRMAGDTVQVDSTPPPGRAYRTAGGRTLYGGGGIAPDEAVASDVVPLPLPLRRWLVEGKFALFAYRQYIADRARIESFPTPSAFAKGYDAAPLWKNFSSSPQGDTLQVSGLSPAQTGYLQRQLIVQLARLRWRNPGWLQVANAQDPLIAAAVARLSR